MYLLRFGHFESRARELTDHLCKRDYQEQAISLAIERARQQKREDLLSNRSKSESSVLLFVLTSHPDLPKVRDKVNKHWPITESSIALFSVQKKHLNSIRSVCHFGCARQLYECFLITSCRQPKLSQMNSLFANIHIPSQNCVATKKSSTEEARFLYCPS